MDNVAVCKSANHVQVQNLYLLHLRGKERHPQVYSENLEFYQNTINPCEENLFITKHRERDNEIKGRVDRDKKNSKRKKVI